MMGAHFSKKFGKRPPPGIIVTTVNNFTFTEKIETFGTAIPNKTRAYNIEKYQVLSPIEFNKKVKKGEIIAKLKSRNILAPFDGIVGKRDFSNDLVVSKSSIVINIEDTSIIFSDLNIPETYSSVVKKGLPIEASFSGYKNKIYEGEIDSIASRINADTRSLSIRIKIINDESELIPGALLSVKIKCNERNRKKPLNKTNIRDNLSQVINDNSQIEQAMQLIMNNREIVKSYVLTKPKSKKNTTTNILPIDPS